MKRNTSNWSNFGMLLRRAGLTASAGLSCCYRDSDKELKGKDQRRKIRNVVCPGQKWTESKEFKISQFSF